MQVSFLKIARFQQIVNILDYCGDFFEGITGKATSYESPNFSILIFQI